MSTYKKDYNKLYQLQLSFLSWLNKLDLPFYLTGGTAISRFYLNHRYSDDLDFFTNATPNFSKYINKVNNKISSRFNVNVSDELFTEDFCRFFITDNEVSLKIEFVNDVEYRAGKPIATSYGLVDTIDNILANKIAAITGRDEPKDVFDIIHIAENYSFNWADIFLHTKHKAAVNEIDVEQRLHTFPIELLTNIKTINALPDLNKLQSRLVAITNDFLLGRNNGNCKTGNELSSAKPTLQERWER